MRNFNTLIVTMIAAVAVLALGVHFGVITPEVGYGGGLAVSMAVQSSYSERMPAAFAGMIASMSSYDADTRIVETTAGIPFGVACSQGSADNGVLIGGASAAVFVGVSVRDATLVDETTDKYADGRAAAIMTRGDIWVTVGGDVTDGGDVTFNSTTGVLSSAGTSGSQFAIAGARWLTTATSGNLAKLRLSGHLPSA